MYLKINHLRTLNAQKSILSIVDEEALSYGVSLWSPESK